MILVKLQSVTLLTERMNIGSNDDDIPLNELVQHLQSSDPSVSHDDIDTIT